MHSLPNKVGPALNLGGILVTPANVSLQVAIALLKVGRHPSYSRQ
jgi:hypothetical protein